MDDIVSIADNIVKFCPGHEQTRYCAACGEETKPIIYNITIKS